MTDMTPGERFKSMRPQLGVSQHGLAVMMGTTQVTISRWEGESPAPSLRALKHVELLVAVRTLHGALKGQHNAIDYLLARLALLDREFLPSHCGPAWQAFIEGNEAIRIGEGYGQQPDNGLAPQDSTG